MCRAYNESLGEGIDTVRHRNPNGRESISHVLGTGVVFAEVSSMMMFAMEPFIHSDSEEKSCSVELLKSSCMVNIC